jgi:hypothetical protein
MVLTHQRGANGVDSPGRIGGWFEGRPFRPFGVINSGLIAVPPPPSFTGTVNTNERTRGEMQVKELEASESDLMMARKELHSAVDRLADDKARADRLAKMALKKVPVLAEGARERG